MTHFSKNTLACIAAKQGFELLDSSTEWCSRPFGFVSIFRKTVNADFPAPQEYQLNKSHFEKGLRQADDFFERLDAARELVRKSTDPIVIWAANETSNRLIDGVEFGKNVCVIDSNECKRDYFKGKCSVLQPKAATRQIAEAAHIILCTQRHANSLLRSLETDYGKSFEESQIHIVDRM